jgi:hypothetical protein
MLGLLLLPLVTSCMGVQLRGHVKRDPHATVYVFLHNLLNVLVQIANKMGLQKKGLTGKSQYLIASRTCEKLLPLRHLIEVGPAV